MSTVFCEKLFHYVSDTRSLSLRESLCKTTCKALRCIRTNKAGRAYLYGGCPSGHVFEHVLHRLDAAKPDYWDSHRFPRFPNQSECDGFDCRTRQAARSIAQT